MLSREGIGRVSVRVALALFTALGLMSASAGSAFAAPAASSSPPPGAVTTQMTLNCTDMSARAHAYATVHNYCPSGRIGPYTTTTGDCGSSWLLMWDGGNGYAEFSYGFQSSQGNVVYRSLNINWNNWSYSSSGSFPDSGWMNNSYYNVTQAVDTGSGYVTGTMNGWVQLWWGGQCTIIPPSDSATVS